MPPPPLPSVTKCKKKRKDKSPGPANAEPRPTAVSAEQVKRRPGRPLSTSATARSLVRELATMHLGRERDEHGKRHSTASAFEPALPAFPEVSAYVDGVYDDNEGRRSSHEISAKQEDESGKRDSQTADRTPGPGNTVAAKERGEMITQRMQSVR